MRYPELAAVPSAPVRAAITPKEWTNYIETSVALIDLYNRLEDRELAAACKGDHVFRFLESFYEAYTTASANDGQLKSAQVNVLAQHCLSFVIKCHSNGQLQSLLQRLDFLQTFARAHARSKSCRTLLEQIWQSYSSQLTHERQRWQATVSSKLESSSPHLALPALQNIAPLLYSSPDIAVGTLTGSDFVEAAKLAYATTSDEDLRHAIVLVVYLGLIGSVNAKEANPSLLSDNLYSLKAQADDKSLRRSTLGELVTNTPLLKQIEHYAGSAKQGGLLKLVQSLKPYHDRGIARPHKRAQKKQNKGKHRQQADHNLHVHRMSRVTQLQDLFPDLGAGFVLRLLDAYDDDVEVVTARLLEETLRPELSALDRREVAPIFDADKVHAVDHLVPASTSTPPSNSFVPQRSNAFDDDELDRLEVESSRLHIGKREEELVEKGQPNKAAILAALAAFDSDDDERDDTYDVEDVGGTVDTAHVDGDDSISASFDEADIQLFKHYEAAPDTFGRSAEIRRGPARAALKQQTGLTDEAIEGWAIMLQRDPKRARKLAFEASRFDGRQKEIIHTAYREGHADTETDESDNAGRGNGFRGRGRGRGRGGSAGRGGFQSGQSSELSTAAAKRRKEANKSSRANHNRRDQRARKMARGGFAGAS